jgi:hypothetical protein
MLLPRFRQTPKKDRYSPRPAGKTFGFGQKLSAGLAYTLMRDADRITHILAGVRDAGVYERRTGG